MIEEQTETPPKTTAKPPPKLYELILGFGLLAAILGGGGWALFSFGNSVTWAFIGLMVLTPILGRLLKLENKLVTNVVVVEGLIGLGLLWWVIAAWLNHPVGWVIGGFLIFLTGIVLLVVLSDSGLFKRVPEGWWVGGLILAAMAVMAWPIFVVGSWFSWLAAAIVLGPTLVLATPILFETSLRRVKVGIFGLFWGICLANAILSSAVVWFTAALPDWFNNPLGWLLASAAIIIIEVGGSTLAILMGAFAADGA